MDKWEQETLLSTFAEFRTVFLHLLLNRLALKINLLVENAYLVKKRRGGGMDSPYLNRLLRHV